MIDGKFDVVFRGQIVKSFEPETVRANLVSLFKSSPEAIERLFTGNETVIRKALDYSAAMKYQAALKNAGALALIKEVTTDAEPAEPPVSRPRASFTSSEKSQGNSQTTVAQAAHSPTPAPQAQQTPQAPQTPQQGRAEGELQDAANSEDLSLAEVGARILPNKVYQQRDVDTSELSLAAVGERILPKKPPEKVAQPNIDHLAITDDTTPIGGD